ncbi:MAG: hypothetical protein JW991_00700 [Candidatus Pacebacteria bacterium]|nr:hypothetical protein [Candidatus Paceibacterota bacterium]
MKKIITGNLSLEAPNHRGWVVGHFMEKETGLQTGNVEVKWAEHKKGEIAERLEAGKRERTKTLTFLVRGKYVFFFPDLDREVILDKEGDFVFYGANLGYVRRAEEDSLVVVLRWPSIKADKG